MQIIRSLSFACVLAAALPVSFARAQAGPCVDQQYVSGNTNGLEITDNQNVIQTFTCARAGILTRIDIDDISRHRGTAQLPLDFALVIVDAAGVPTNVALFTQTFQPSAVGATRGTVTVDVSAIALAVQPGDVYGIKLSTLSPSGGSTYAWWGDAPGSYTRGEIYIRDNAGPLSFDLGFRTWVDFGGGGVMTYGAAFGGQFGPPSLGTSAFPTVGSSFDITCGNPTSGPAIAGLVIGAVRANTPTPFGGTLLVDPLAVVGLQLPGQFATLRVPVTVANDPTSCGLTVMMQLLVADPSAVAGVGFSAAIEIVVGP